MARLVVCSFQLSISPLFALAFLGWAAYALGERVWEGAGRAVVATAPEMNSKLIDVVTGT